MFSLLSLQYLIVFYTIDHLFLLIVFGCWFLFHPFYPGWPGWVTAGSVLGPNHFILTAAFVVPSLWQHLESPD